MRTAALAPAVALVFFAACGGEASSNEDPAGTGGTAGQAPQDCTGTKPSTMVALPEGFSIDATEVSRCQYQAWLDTAPLTTGQDPSCAFNTDFTPQCEWPPAKDGSLPVVCVDWCDAFAYCKAMGMRLCGKIGGGSNAMEDLDDPSKSQWYAACSSGGKHAYPYGDAYGLGMYCNDADKDAVHTLYPVGSLAGCQPSEPSYRGIFDLSGNVWEWDDSCDGSSGTDMCLIRGGSSFSPEGFASCAKKMASLRNDAKGAVLGFRCCSQ